MEESHSVNCKPRDPPSPSPGSRYRRELLVPTLSYLLQLLTFLCLRRNLILMGQTAQVPVPDREQVCELGRTSRLVSYSSYGKWYVICNFNDLPRKDKDASR
jgi:hypothetical protein